MPLVHHQGKRIFFAHVPKAGGSSVEEYLTRRFGALDLHHALNDAMGRRGGILTPPQHLTATDVSKLIASYDACFAFVRDPFERIVSEFRFQHGSGRSAWLGFSMWLRMVISAAAREPRIYDNHIRPQTDFIPADASIFRLEHGLTPMVDWLDAQTQSSRPDLTPNHLLGSLASRPDPSRQDLALIRDFYAADYQRFGYEIPTLDNYPSDALSNLRKALGAPLGWALVHKQRRRWNLAK